MSLMRNESPFRTNVWLWVMGALQSGWSYFCGHHYRKNQTPQMVFKMTKSLLIHWVVWQLYVEKQSFRDRKHLTITIYIRPCLSRAMICQVHHTTQVFLSGTIPSSYSLLQSYSYLFKRELLF